MAKRSPSNHPPAEDSPSASQGIPMPADWRYEETVAIVETIIQRIEAGELDLAATFDEFAIAVHHLRQCDAFLSQQRQKMELLVETLMDDPESF